MIQESEKKTKYYNLQLKHAMVQNKTAFRLLKVPNKVRLPTVDFSGEEGTSKVSLVWFTRSCWEWEKWIWFQLFFLDCLGGKAGGCPSSGVSCDLGKKRGEEMNIFCNHLMEISYLN